MFDLSEELAAIRDELAARRLEFAVCGGIAMAIHGFTRATEDLDLFVRPQDTEAIEGSLAMLGFLNQSYSKTGTSMALTIRRVLKIDARDDDKLAVDLLLANSESGLAWESREILTWRGHPLPVVSARWIDRAEASPRNGHGSHRHRADAE